jgi:surface protein
VFSPQSKDELKSAVNACLEVSSLGDCPTGPHGLIGEWDVSRVTEMGWLFFDSGAFNQGLSKWDVSRVTGMLGMFAYAHSFNQDLSKWDVSRVTSMTMMFNHAGSFNQDLSKWDVSHVTDMKRMFADASSFQQTLCGAAWVNSKASKMDMFSDSPGSISETVCGEWVYYFCLLLLFLFSPPHTSFTYP